MDGTPKWASLSAAASLIWERSRGTLIQSFRPVSTRFTTGLGAASVANRWPKSRGGMRPSTSGSVSISSFGAILLLLTAVGDWGPTARGGCSMPYTGPRSPAQSDADLARFDLLAHFGAIPANDHDIENETPPRRSVPCSGALCSDSPALPLSTMPLVQPVGTEQWAALPLAVPLTHSVSMAHPSADVGLDPVDCSPSIFHPPRSHAPSHIVEGPGPLP